jgi:hypothetical protein
MLAVIFYGHKLNKKLLNKNSDVPFQDIGKDGG